MEKQTGKPPQSLPKIVASIVTYNNSQEEVIKTAESFLNSNLSLQLIIVDNNSPNIILNSLKGKIDAKFIQSGCNKGFGFGHNIAIKSAPASEYFLVLNPDIIIHKGSLEKIVKFMDLHKEVGLISPRILNQDGSIQYLNKRLPTFFDMFLRRALPSFIQRIKVIKKRMDYYIMKDKGYEEIQKIPYMTGSFMLFRKSVLSRVGYFDERFFMYLEDADITVRVNEISKAIYFPDAAVTHAWARGSHNSLKLTLITISSAIYFFRKWGWRWI